MTTNRDKFLMRVKLHIFFLLPPNSHLCLVISSFCFFAAPTFWHSKIFLTSQGYVAALPRLTVLSLIQFRAP